MFQKNVVRHENLGSVYMNIRGFIHQTTTVECPTAESQFAECSRIRGKWKLRRAKCHLELRLSSRLKLCCSLQMYMSEARKTSHLCVCSLEHPSSHEYAGHRCQYYTVRVGRKKSTTCKRVHSMLINHSPAQLALWPGVLHSWQLLCSRSWQR